MEDGKYKDAGISAQGPVLKKLDNFWYHYKWHTVVIAFFVIVFLVGSLQMCSGNTYDSVLCYAGPKYIAGEDLKGIREVLNAKLPEDFDGDGIRSAEVVTYFIMSGEQIQEEENTTDKDGNEVQVYFPGREAIAENKRTFTDHIMTGDFSICFLDPHLFEELVKNERVANVTEILGYSPESLYSEYGVKLSELDIYKDYKLIRELPSDTVVCLLNKQLTKSQESFENEIALFEALVK